MEKETILQQETQLEKQENTVLEKQQEGTVLETDTTVLEKLPTWPGWKTVCRLGGGSFGAVYEIHRTVADSVEKAALKVISIPKDRDEIKRLYSEGYESDSITAHFEHCLNATLKEYALIIDLKGHPNIVRSDDIRHIRRDNGVGWDIYIKMELLQPLGDMLGPGFDERLVIRLGKDICSALIACEENQIIHRDIKPANILVGKDGTCKLGDFGVARISEQTYANTLAGSFDYMSPEVYHGRGYDHRADIYSLGIVLYWMMNHKRGPFLPQSSAIPTNTMLEKARESRFGGKPLPKPANGSDELWEIVRKACAFDPKKRYANAKEMKAALDRLDGAVPPPPPPPPWKLIALITGGILAAAGLFFAFGGEKDPCAQGHTWQAATCTDPQTCQVCGITEGASLGHSWSAASCDTPGACTVCGETGGSALGHLWQAATCTAPETCVTCGETRGETADHVWNPANCESPETCTRCGTVQGEPLAHQWSPASCNNPQMCELCGKTEGDPLGHLWEPATFLTPRFCTRCGHYDGYPRSYADIDVENEVRRIREIYYAIMVGVEDGTLYSAQMREGVTGYYDAGGELKRIVVYRGTEGIGPESEIYSRSYYFDGGKLIFAFFEGVDSHRLYFYDELLMRWLYSSGEIEEFTFSERYMELEKYARDEGIMLWH